MYYSKCIILAGLICLPSSSTSAYCQARSRLPLITLRNIFKHTVSVLDKSSISNINFHNRGVKVVDGTGLSMPDTPKIRRDIHKME